VFLIPEERAKNGRERIVPLNAIARSIIDSRRSRGEYVFELKGKRLSRMNNKAWLKAREAAGLKEVRVHDLRPSANACALPGSVWRIDRTCSGTMPGASRAIISRRKSPT
jgi:integrase